jgi:predicted Fe-Mo cluster-binding NifX family protein
VKIAVTATYGELDAHMDPRFGRAPYFVIVETDDMSYEAMENPNIALGGGAGIQSAQLVAGKGVQAVLTGNCGPNAYQTLSAAGIEVVVGVAGTVREAVLSYKAGAFAAAPAPNVESHFGTGTGAAQTAPQPQAAQALQQGIGTGFGQGPGGGMGGGMGRGMGGGMGRGAGMMALQQLEAVQDQIAGMQGQINEILTRLSKLESKG